MQLKKKTLPTDFCTFISKILCDLEKDSCMFSMCLGCPGIECIKPQENLNSMATMENNENPKVNKFQCADSGWNVERESVKNDENKVIIQNNFAKNFNKFNMQDSHPTGPQNTIFIVCDLQQNDSSDMPGVILSQKWIWLLWPFFVSAGHCLQFLK